MGTLFQITLFLGLSGAPPAEDASPHVELKSYPVADELRGIVDWSWNGGSLLALTLPSDQGRRIQLAELGHNGVVPLRGGDVGTGSAPVFIDRTDFVFVTSNSDALERMRVTGGGGKRVSSMSHSFPGGICEVRFIDGHLWLFTLGDDADKPIVHESFRVPPSLDDVLGLGTGCYARPVTEDRFLITDTDREYALATRSFQSDPSDTRTLIERHAFFPAYCRPAAAIVFQHGLADDCSVEVATLDGEALRTISRGHRNGTNPRTSPSGQYVALAEVPKRRDDYVFVVVARLDGTRLFERETLGFGVTHLYRWSPSEDRLAVLTRSRHGVQELRILEFSRVD